jgi:arylformamidase
VKADFIERQYNVRAAVPEHLEWFARWAELSARARDALLPKLDVRFGPGPKETLDLFVPSGEARGTLVFIHGGYWRALDKSDHSFVATPFVERGLAVAVLNYDLCPAVTIAGIVDECRRALAWLVREGAVQGANPRRIVAAGHSAGGHLATMLLAAHATALGLREHPLCGVVTVSGIHDLTPMTQFSYNADLRLDRADAVRLSPLNHTPAGAAPVLAVVGADETAEFHRQARVLLDAWPRHRVRDEPLIVPGRHHFSVIVDYADADSELTRSTLAMF